MECIPPQSASLPEFENKNVKYRNAFRYWVIRKTVECAPMNETSRFLEWFFEYAERRIERFDIRPLSAWGYEDPSTTNLAPKICRECIEHEQHVKRKIEALKKASKKAMNAAHDEKPKRETVRPAKKRVLRQRRRPRRRPPRCFFCKRHNPVRLRKGKWICSNGLKNGVFDGKPSCCPSARDPHPART